MQGFHWGWVITCGAYSKSSIYCKRLLHTEICLYVCIWVSEWMSEEQSTVLTAHRLCSCEHSPRRGFWHTSVNALFVPDCCLKCWRSLVMLIVYRLVKVFKFFISLTSLNTTLTADFSIYCTMFCACLYKGCDFTVLWPKAPTDENRIKAQDCFLLNKILGEIFRIKRYSILDTVFE